MTHNQTECNCCSPAQPVTEAQSISKHIIQTHCPQCDNRGKVVDSATLKSQLAVSLRKLRDATYYFCRESGCDVVYFSDDSAHYFTKVDLRERVFQKEPSADDVYVCYCFNHTPQSIRSELIETGRTTVVDEINAGIKAGQCACDWRNPQGTCCLGNVRKLVQHIEAQIEKKTR